MKFGEYMKTKRLEKGITQTKAAKMYDISLSYLSGIERGERSAPSTEKLNNIAKVFDFNQKEIYQLYDLAAESKQPPTLADDVIEYIYKYPAIRDMLRYSMECDMKEKDWDLVISFIKKNFVY